MAAKTACCGSGVRADICATVFDDIMKSPTLMGDAEGKPTLAADGRFVVVDGVSTCTALTNMFSKISESDDDMNLRQRGFTQALTAD